MRGYKRPTYSHPLKTIIHQKGMNYETFAEQCGLNKDTIQAIIRRRRWGKKPTKYYKTTIEGIACGLDVSYEEAERLVYGL